MRARHLKFSMIAALPFSFGLAPNSALAEPADDQATASIQVIAPLSVTINRVLSFGRLQVRGGTGPTFVTINPAGSILRQCMGVICLAGSEAAMTATIRGEPNRSYRIALPASTVSTPGNFRVSALTIVSASRGNNVVNGYGRLDALGVEELRIGGTLILNRTARLGVYTANVPITVLYE